MSFAFLSLPHILPPPTCNADKTFYCLRLRQDLLHLSSVQSSFPVSAGREVERDVLCTQIPPKGNLGRTVTVTALEDDPLVDMFPMAPRPPVCHERQTHFPSPCHKGRRRTHVQGSGSGLSSCEFALSVSGGAIAIELFKWPAPAGDWAGCPVISQRAR